MAIILQDSFTDETGIRLEDHTPEIGLWQRRSIGDYAHIVNFAMSNDYYLLSYYNAEMSKQTDMSIQFKLVLLGAENVAFLCRMSSVEPLNAFGLHYAGTFSDNTIWQFILYNAGVITVLKEFHMAVIAGAVVKFEVVGNVLNCYLNDVLIDTITDDNYVDGLAGFRYTDWNATISQWDDALIEVAAVAMADHLPLMGVH